MSGHALPIGSHTSQDGPIVVDVSFEPLEMAKGHLPEERAGPPQQGCLIAATVVVDPPREERRGDAQTSVSHDVLAEFRKRRLNLFGLLARGRRAIKL